MMKLRLLSTVAIVSVATAALSGCVTSGNTHALITPVGVMGYHTFKPDHTTTPREINLPERAPDRIAATNERDERSDRNEGT